MTLNWDRSAGSVGRNRDSFVLRQEEKKEVAVSSSFQALFGLKVLEVES
jgi:hypothetical protein